MNEKFRRIRAVFDLEFDVSFPFPVAEALLIMLSVLITMSMVMMQRSYFPFLVTSSDYSNSLELERIANQVLHIDFHLISIPLFQMTMITIIVIPLLCAFRVAGPIEDGTFKAMLSYPIRRKELLILKGFEIIVLICLPITTGILTGVVLYNGLSVSFESVLVIISFWTLSFMILSSSLLLSVATQSSAKSTFGGVTLWVILLLVGMFSKLPTVFRGILNPVILTISYFMGIPLGNQYDVEPILDDVLISIICNLLFGIAMYLGSIKYFKRVEI